MKKNDNIKTFRIGNEIQIKWPILTNGEEVSLDGRRLSLYLSDQWGNDRKVETFGTEGNVIVFSFFASEQLKTGVYRLTLYENMGKANQLCTDYCFAFKLVAHSCDIPSDMASNELPLDSTNVEVGIHGLSAYEIAVNYGYEGSEEQWAREFNTVLTSTQLIAAYVERSEMVLRRSEELFEGLSIIQQSEQGRVDAEAIREENERQRQQTFQSAEQQRDQDASENESQRQQNFNIGESSRQQTFETNEILRESRLAEAISEVENAESQRQSAESARQVTEEERASSESARRLNENTRQESETTRNTNESNRIQQETRRASSETERVQNELLRQSDERLRIADEQGRVAAEEERTAAEQARAQAESQRASAELKREQDTSAAISGIASQIESKHQEYQQTINETVSQAQADVQAAINDFNRTRRVAQTESEVAIQPNVKNIWSSPMQELTITFVAGTAGYDNEYMIQFQCPSDSATVLTLPSSVKWVNDEPIELQEGWVYQISIIDNLALYAGWEAATV